MILHRISALGQVCLVPSQFESVLTRHYTHPALDFRKWLGGEEKINEYCRNLAIEGGKKLAETIGTEEVDKTPDHALTLNMVRSHLLPLGAVLKFLGRLT